MFSELVGVAGTHPLFTAFAIASLLIAVYVPLADDRWASEAYGYFGTTAGRLGWMALYWAWLLPAIGVVGIANGPILRALGTPLPGGPVTGLAILTGYALWFFAVRFAALKVLRSTMERRIARLRMSMQIGALFPNPEHGEAEQ